MASSADATRWIHLKLDAAGAHPLGQFYRDLAALYTEKLWHQLTLKLEEFLAQEYWTQTNAAELHELYSCFISSFTGKLNSLRLALMAVTLSRFFVDLPPAITFLEDIVNRVSGSPTALVVARCTLGKLKLFSGDGPECKKILEEARVTLDNTEGAESSVYIAYYDASTAYFEKYGPAADYFKNGLLYLAYTPLDTIPKLRQQELAFSLCVASLVGESVYSFGELLSQPLLAVLEDTNRSWIIQIVKSFNAGDIDEYERLQVTFKDQLNAEPVLLQNVRLLTEKISVLALMELVFKRPSENRAIPFSVIAEHTKLAVNEVELLVMKALSLKLVKGAIDQVDQVVTFTWVQPRVLDLAQIAGLKTRLADWQTKVQDTLIDVENQTLELFV